ncbi:MAG: GntR family transcriptional regulator [Lachnospiraceae bacterium]|nr:GntR family transcriptional regulator [Lachnospiraceae bacterium]
MKFTNRLQQETARDYAFRVLRDNIVSLELKPGTLISENEMAMELGLSRTPVREAIIDLAKVSIIETIPQRGSYVALIDTKMVEESRFLRKVLDEAVIEVACDIADSASIDAMEENVHLQEFYLEKSDTNRIFELDNAFHKLIYSAAQKDIIYDIRSTMMLHFDRVRTLSVEAVKDMKIVGDHRGMLEAIKGHDKEAAVALVEKHLGRYRVDETKIREEFPAYFK